MVNSFSRSKNVFKRTSAKNTLNVEYMYCTVVVNVRESNSIVVNPHARQLSTTIDDTAYVWVQMLSSGKVHTPQIEQRECLCWLVIVILVCMAHMHVRMFATLAHHPLIERVCAEVA